MSTSMTTPPENAPIVLVMPSRWRATASMLGERWRLRRERRAWRWVHAQHVDALLLPRP